MKTNYFLSSLLMAGMVLVVTDVSAMHQSYSDLPDYSSREQSPARLPDAQAPETELIEALVKAEPDEEGNLVEPVVLPGGEDRNSAIDVDVLNAEIVDLRNKSNAIQKELSTTKGVSTRRANKVKNLQEELNKVTTTLNKKVAALAKALKDKKALVAKVAALEVTIVAMQEKIDALEKAAQNVTEEVALETEQAEDAAKGPEKTEASQPVRRGFLARFFGSGSQPAAK